jgi:hypothetical protein
MIKVDIVNFYDNLKEKWETKIGVILLIILVIPIYFLLFDYFVGRESTYNWLVYKVLIPLVMLLLIICYWLYNTNRFFLRTTGKITAGIIVIIDNEKDKPVISKIVSKVVHHINNSTAFSNVSLKILPANSFVTKKEIEKYHRNFNFMYDIIIQLFIESGQYDSIEKIIVEKLSVTFRPKDGIKQKRVFFNTVDLSRDMDLQVKSRDWEYKLSNSGVDNKKYFENILPMFLYYLGFYAIYVDRFEDALEIMTPIYNSKNTIVPISKKEGNILELKLKPLNLAEARLATILVDLFAALEGELDGTLAEESEDGERNRRNGHNTKYVKSRVGPLEISTPRDRQGIHDPKLIGKWDRELSSGMDEIILSMYAHGQSIEDIRRQLHSLYGIEMSAGTISAITDRVYNEIINWQQRTLNSCYAIVYLDAIYYKIREDSKVVTKAVYTVYGVDLDGQRDILGFYLQAFTQL